MKFIYTNYLTMLLLVQATCPESASGNFDPNSFDIGIDPSSVEFEENNGLYGNPRQKPKDLSRRDTITRYEREDNDNGNNNDNSNNGKENEDAQVPRCAVMFKNNEPVGILQPFEDSYKFLPVSGEPTVVDINPLQVQKKSIMDVLYPGNAEEYYDDVEDRSEEKVGYTDDKYPSIFAKFKIDSRLAKSVQNGDEKSLATVKKRSSEEAEAEDKFGSLKATLSKIKTDDSVEVEEELRSILDDMGLIEDYPQEKEKEKREAEAEDENLESGTNRISLARQAEEGDRRDKRDEDYESHSPTARSETPLDLMSAEGLGTEAAKERDPRSGDYEKRFEREIRDKIEKLKEEVRKEIEDLKTVKDKNKSNDDDAKRKKRQINSLLDEETKEIDPNVNGEGDQTAGHVRIKRGLLRLRDVKGGRRKKREVAEVLRQFEEDDRGDAPGEYEDYQQNGRAQENESNDNDDPAGDSSFLNWQDPHCNCDKKGSNCRCIKLLEQESQRSGAPKGVQKKSSQTNCNCANGHCVCEDVKDEEEEQGAGAQGAATTPPPTDAWEERDAKRATQARKFESGEYYVDLHPDVYKLTPAAHEQRDKRSDTFQGLLAEHGGARAGDHLVAIRQRGMAPLARSRRRVQRESNSEPRQLIDMSEEDLFGALPQSFEGELARYKRVKRTKEKT